MIFILTTEIFCSQIQFWGNFDRYVINDQNEHRYVVVGNFNHYVINDQNVHGTNYLHEAQQY